MVRFVRIENKFEFYPIGDPNRTIPEFQRNFRKKFRFETPRTLGTANDFFLRKSHADAGAGRTHLQLQAGRGALSHYPACVDNIMNIY